MPGRQPPQGGPDLDVVLPGLCRCPPGAQKGAVHLQAHFRVEWLQRLAQRLLPSPCRSTGQQHSPPVRTGPLKQKGPWYITQGPSPVTDSGYWAPGDEVAAGAVAVGEAEVTSSGLGLLLASEAGDSLPPAAGAAGLAAGAFLASDRT